MGTALKILDVCHRASLSFSKLSPQMVSQIVRETYSSVTVEGKHVKMKFAEPFATIEKLIRTAHQGIERYGYDEFANIITMPKVQRKNATKKSPEGSICANSSSSILMNWWA